MIGAFGDGEYLLPTSVNEIIRSLACRRFRAGTPDHEFPTWKPGRRRRGNDLAEPDQAFGSVWTAIVWSRWSISMLQDNPDDLDALIRKSELLIEQDQRQQALEVAGTSRNDRSGKPRDSAVERLGDARSIARQ